MKDFDTVRAKVAKWIREHEDQTQAHYWEWEDLTDLNRATDALKLPMPLALHVFNSLVQGGFLMPVDVPGKKHTFLINHAMDAEWKEIMSPHFDLLRYVRSKLIDWSGGAIVGIAITAAVSWAFCPANNKRAEPPIQHPAVPPSQSPIKALPTPPEIDAQPPAGALNPTNRT